MFFLKALISTHLCQYLSMYSKDMLLKPLKAIMKAKLFFFTFIQILNFFLLTQPVVAKETQKDSFVIFFDQQINSSHIALLATRELGFFSDLGLDVNFVLATSPREAFQQIIDDRGLLAVTTQTRLFLFVGDGIAVKRIATLIDTPLSGIVTLTKSNIRIQQDLKGKRLGYQADSLDAKIIQAVLSNTEKSFNEIQFVSLDQPITQALLEGYVDAIITTERQKTIGVIEAHKKTAFLLPIEELGIPPFDGVVAIAARNKLNDPKLKRFLQALEHGTLWVLDHPQDAWKLIAQKYNFFNNEAEQRAYPDLLNRLSAQPQAFSSLRYKRFASFLVEHDLITVALPISNYAVELNDESKP